MGEFGVDESLVIVERGIVDREIGWCGGREGRHLECAGQAFTVEYRHRLRFLVDLQQGARQRRVEAASLELANLETLEQQGLLASHDARRSVAKIVFQGKAIPDQA